MKCQNAGIGDALYHSIKVAASERWPAFGEQSGVMIDWYQRIIGRISIPILESGSFNAIFVDETTPLDLFRRPSFRQMGFEPVDIPELPHNVQFGYNGIFDILFIALRPGIKHKEGEA